MNKFECLKKIFPHIKKPLNGKIGQVKMNSNEVKKNDIFLAIQSGNRYIESALKRGASFVFYDDMSFKKMDERLIYVKNTVFFMQKLAKIYRKSLDLIVIGVTGSEGKTSTKDILYSILSKKYRGKKTQGNYNNHIGLPFSILQLEQDDEFIVLEMGMSKIGEIKLLRNIATPNYAIITNIGDSHLEFLGNRDNVFNAKTEILESIKPEFRIVYGDDPYLKKIRAVKVGNSETNDYIITDFTQNQEGSQFKLNLDNNKIHISTNLYGQYNSINISLAIAIALKIGVSRQIIIDACHNLQLTKMRFEKVIKNGMIFIDDAYNASPESMKHSLETFNSIFKQGYKIAILGDMLELGSNSIVLHENIAEVIKKIELDKIYLIGKKMRFLYEKLNYNNCFYYENIEQIKNNIYKEKKGTVILLKASKGVMLNKILE